MKILATGGGTGGHVYPALEIALAARDAGAEVHYGGSLRGQEGQVCLANNIPFKGYDVGPIYSFRTVQGLKAILKILRASGQAKADLKQWRPDAIFSTGGYSSAPIMRAASGLNIPLVVHEANSVPGRSTRTFAKVANAFTCVFRHTEELIPGALRTGQPIRRELVEAARADLAETKDSVLILGGSQGSEYLNKVMPQVAERLKGQKFIHAVGPKNFEAFSKLPLPEGYDARPYLSGDQMAEAYRRAMLVVGRSGGSLAEFALFRLPSVLIPLPQSALDHQLHNAYEFEAMKAATVCDQHTATIQGIADEISGWLSSEARRDVAASALASWDLAGTSVASLLAELNKAATSGS